MIRIEGDSSNSSQDMVRRIKMAGQATDTLILCYHTTEDGRRVITTEALPLVDIEGLVNTIYGLKDPQSIINILRLVFREPEDPILYRYRG